MILSPLVSHAKFGIFVQPGISIFSDTVGYDIQAGANVLYFTQALFLGGSIHVSGANSSGTGIFNISLAADISYDIYLYFLPKIPLVATPTLSVGWAYGNLNNISYGYSQKMGLLLAPKVELSYVINETMRAGLFVGYSLYEYDIPISYLQVGLSYSYYLGVHKLNKEALKGDKDEKVL